MIYYAQVCLGTDFYCIRVSSVCDGQYDFLYGNDDKYCERFVCPGFLKFRGENRCVGPEEVWDCHLNSIHSFDNELMCRPCSKDCVEAI